MAKYELFGSIGGDSDGTLIIIDNRRLIRLHCPQPCMFRKLLVKDIKPLGYQPLAYSLGSGTTGLATAVKLYFSVVNVYWTTESFY